MAVFYHCLFSGREKYFSLTDVVICIIVYYRIEIEKQSYENNTCKFGGDND